MKDRNEAFNNLYRKIRRVALNTKKVKEHSENIYKRYEMPRGISSDYFTLRRDISEATDFEAYILYKELDENDIPKYFTETEIEKYDSAKFIVKSISFPLRFKMVQITDGSQWIGRIDIKELMKLRDAQLINYNENAQRTMERVIAGDKEFYKIALNKKAVSAIMESFSNETYIPNTLTLNMPIDTEFRYDDNDLTLIISNISHFDILDGYHRYVAISNMYNRNRNFNYDMELRIVNFPESKAKQFIWQEDQKTKMKKVDSDSFNQNSAANKIVSRMNADPTFNLQGQLSRNNGIINSAYLAQAIGIIYMKGVLKRDENVKIISVTKELINKINYVTEQDSTLLTDKWKRKFIVCVIYCCAHFPKEEVLIEANSLYKKLSKEENKYILRQSIISQIDITRLSKL